MKCGKMAKIIIAINGLFDCLSKLLQKYFSPILLLSLRIIIALVFYRSGMSKLANFEATVFLFEEDYQVPLLPPMIAAYMATATELIAAYLLFAGFATRIAAAALFALTCVIQFLVISNHEHFYWFSILGTLIIYGGGLLSLDHFLKKFTSKCSKI